MKKIRYAFWTLLWETAVAGERARSGGAVGVIPLSLFCVAVSVAAVFYLPQQLASIPLGALAALTTTLSAVIITAFVAPRVELKLRHRWYKAADAVDAAKDFGPLA